MFFKQRVLFVIPCLWLLLLGVRAQQPPKLEPLPLKEGLAALSFSNLPLSICPGDEQWIAYQLNDVRRHGVRVGKYEDLTATGVPSLGGGGDIWLTNVRTGESRNLTGSLGSNWALSWSPNGLYLAFYSDRDGRSAIWIWDKKKDQLRKLSEAIPRSFLYGYETPNWTPDSRRLLVKIFPSEEVFKRLTADPREVASLNTASVTIYDSKLDPGKADKPVAMNSDALKVEEVVDSQADLALIDIADGNVTRLSENYLPAGYALSPDGKKVAFLNAKGVGSLGPAFDLLVISLAEKQPLLLARDLIQGSLGERFTWSPDSKVICYLSQENWYLISAAGGNASKVTEKDHPAFKAWEQLPLWSDDGRHLYLSTHNSIWEVDAANGDLREIGQVKDRRLQFVVTTSSGKIWTTNVGDSLILSFRDDTTKKSGFCSLSLSNGRVTTLLEEDTEFRRLPWVTASPAQESFYFVAQDASHAPDIWVMATSGKSAPRRLTHINPVFDRYVMGEGKLVEWTSGDGERLKGALILPANYQKGRRYPLVVNVYGGSFLSDKINQFGFTTNTNVINQQFWATRGYAVLLPDTPLRVGTTMLDLAKTVLPGIDKVIEMGIADPDRLGVWGGSYGGYSTLALLVQTGRFKAAAIDAGFASMMSLYGWMPERSNGPSWQYWAESFQGRMGGTPWKFRERYLANSPIYYFDRLQTPLLIIQGAKDAGGRDYYSNEIFMSLSRLGKEATYLKYPNGGHTISSFNYNDQVDALQRLLNWFDVHLKNSPDKSR